MFRKFLLPIGLACSYFIYSCTPDPEKEHIVDIKKILNKTPGQVEQILGEADTSYMISIANKKYFAQKYFKSNTEIQYPEGTATDIVVYGPHDLPFDATALKAFNLHVEESPSQYREKQLIRWYDHNEFAFITLYHPEFDSAGNIRNFYIFFKASE